MIDIPRIKKSEPAFVGMKRLLIGHGLNAPALAAVLGVSEPTARKRLEKPETLTLADLDRINRIGFVPIELIRSAVSR